MVTKLRVGLIGLAEAGNLGDDLILVATVGALGSSPNVSEIKYIGYGQRLDWDSLRQSLGLRLQPKPVIPRRDLPGSLSAGKVFADCDLIIFGGGGLIQTSHNPERPYQWLRYLPVPRRGGKVVAVGLGLGPISARWERHLKRLGMPFDECYLRDADSVAYANQTLGWRAGICKDFVDPIFLRSLVAAAPPVPERILGIALRDWVDLDPRDLVSHILKVVDEVRPSSVRFFVLESKDGRGVDVDFTESIITKCNLPNSSTHVYGGDDLLNFMKRLTECSVGISMKLHSSAVWAAYGIPIYPIVYSPKIAAFFGIPYDGTSIIARTVAPHEMNVSVPRAQDIVRKSISGPRPDEQPKRNSMGAMTRLDSQFRSLCFNLSAKVRKAMSSS